MKRITVGEFIRVRGIGKTGIRTRSNGQEETKKNRKGNGEGFRRVFDAEIKRLEEKDGKFEETNIKPETNHGGARAQLEELACAMQGRR